MNTDDFEVITRKQVVSLLEKSRAYQMGLARKGTKRAVQLVFTGVDGKLLAYQSPWAPDSVTAGNHFRQLCCEAGLEIALMPTSVAKQISKPKDE